MKKILRVFSLFFCLPLISFGQVEKADKTVEIPGPAFKDVLSLRSVGSPVISPCGKHVLFTVRQADWEKNRYDTEIWLSRDGAEPFQLTRTPDESSDSPSWPAAKKAARSI